MAGERAATPWLSFVSFVSFRFELMQQSRESGSGVGVGVGIGVGIEIEIEIEIGVGVEWHEVKEQVRTCPDRGDAGNARAADTPGKTDSDFRFRCRCRPRPRGELAGSWPGVQITQDDALRTAPSRPADSICEVFLTPQPSALRPDPHRNQTSTRRFFNRPSSLEFGATGTAPPKPIAPRGLRPALASRSAT
jgi:hypothetical protein